jgi:tetratricopeptide (TPR) repeat protein
MSLSQELNRQGNLHFERGDYADAQRCYQRALEADRQSGNARELALTLGNLANICACTGRADQARAHYREVLALQKTFGDQRGIGITLANLGNLEADAGAAERGEAYYLEALDLLEPLDEPRTVATILGNLGLIARGRGDSDRAIQLTERAVVLMKRVGDRAGTAGLYNQLGKTYRLMCRLPDAEACCRTALDIAGRLGDERLEAAARYHLAFIHAEQGQFAQAVEMMERVVAIDAKYQLPKLEENRGWLNQWREKRISEEKAD